MRLALLIALAVGLTVVAVLTWGSIGSATMILCLMLLGASLLWQRFLTNRGESDFDMEQ